MAEAIARWVRKISARQWPNSGRRRSPLRMGLIYCRGRNNDASAKISEHGRGNAFDLGPIKLANGAVMIEQQGHPAVISAAPPGRHVSSL